MPSGYPRAARRALHGAGGHPSSARHGHRPCTDRCAARSPAPSPPASGPRSSRSTSASSASPYDDTELLGKARDARAPAWPAAGLAMHLANGAAFGALYANVAPRMPLPSWARGPAAALAEHFATWPLTASPTACTPRATSCRSSSANPRAFAQATWRHLLFGVVLGELERRLNAADEAEVPAYEHVVSTNGHGDLEHGRGVARP